MYFFVQRTEFLAMTSKDSIFTLMYNSIIYKLIKYRVNNMIQIVILGYNIF